MEHATFFDDECADLALTHRKGAMVVPTLLVVHTLRSRAHLMPEWAMKKLLYVADKMASAISLAHKRGVPIALGTDSLTYGPDSANPWGFHGTELRLLVELAGLWF